MRVSPQAPLLPARLHAFARIAPPGQVAQAPVAQDTVELQAPPPPATPSRWLRNLALAAISISSLAALPPVLAAPIAPAQAQTVATLWDVSGPAAARPNEATTLSRTFARMDPSVLQLLQKDGVTVGLVRPGQAFAELGVTTGRTLESYTAKLPAMQAQAARGRAAARPFDERLRTLTNEQQIGAAKKGRKEAVADALVGADIVPFQIPSMAGRLSDGRALHELVAQQAMPKGTALMATLVGARSSEQIKEYNALVEAINGDRLAEARAKTMAGATPAQQQKWLQDPTLIPFDARAESIFVPDLAYVGGQRVDLDTAQAASGWADANGRTLPAYDRDKDAGSGVNGQYFPGARRVLLQSTKLGPAHGHAQTPIHELGHALEDSVQRHDPRFYASWSARLDSAYDAAVSNKTTVSSYATTNPAEYIAEGVGHYYENPEQLKSKDPALYKLTAELVGRAALILQQKR